MNDEKLVMVEGDLDMARAITSDINEIFMKHDKTSENKTMNALSALTAIFNIMTGIHIALCEGLKIPREVMLENFDRNIAQVRELISKDSTPAPSNETDPHKH
jgi:hypothetical protein